MPVGIGMPRQNYGIGKKRRKRKRGPFPSDKRKRKLKSLNWLLKPDKLKPSALRWWE